MGKWFAKIYWGLWHQIIKNNLQGSILESSLYMSQAVFHRLPMESQLFLTCPQVKSSHLLTSWIVSAMRNRWPPHSVRGEVTHTTKCGKHSQLVSLPHSKKGTRSVGMWMYIKISPSRVCPLNNFVLCLWCETTKSNNPNKYLQIQGMSLFIITMRAGVYSSHATPKGYALRSSYFFL